MSYTSETEIILSNIRMLWKLYAFFINFYELYISSTYLCLKKDNEISYET